MTVDLETYKRNVMAQYSYINGGGNISVNEVMLPNISVVMVTPPWLSEANDYYGVIYKDNSTGQYYMANRGSDSLRDFLPTNLQFSGLLSSDGLPDQYHDARAFLNLASQNLGIPESSFIQVGHSLGGGLAKLLSIATGSIATVFNAPSVGGIVNKLEVAEGVSEGTFSSQNLISRLFETDSVYDSVHNLPYGAKDSVVTQTTINAAEGLFGTFLEIVHKISTTIPSLDPFDLVGFFSGFTGGENGSHGNPALLRTMAKELFGTQIINKDLLPVGESMVARIGNIFYELKNVNGVSEYTQKPYTEISNPEVDTEVVVYHTDVSGDTNLYVYGQSSSSLSLSGALQTDSSLQPTNVFLQGADTGLTAHYIGLEDSLSPEGHLLQDALAQHMSDVTSLDLSGIDAIAAHVNGLSYYDADAKAGIPDGSGGTYQVALGSLVNMVEKGVAGFATFMTEVVSGTISEVNNQSPVLIAQIIAGVIAGRDIEDIAEEIAIQAVSMGAVEATLNALGGITKDAAGNVTISNEFGALLNDNALATEAIKGALTSVAMTAILHGSEAGFKDYAKAATSASVSRVINYGITNSGYNLLTQQVGTQTVTKVVNGVATTSTVKVYAPTPAGAGAIAALTVVSSSLIAGNGVNEDTLRAATVAAGTAVAGSVIAGALFGTAATASAAATAGLFATYGAFAGPAGIIIGAVLGVVIGNLFKSVGEKVYHNETIGSIVQTLPDGTQILIGVREAGALLQANNNVADLIGTEGDDVLKGNNIKNTIIANGGDDMLEGRTGEDVLLAGAGNDYVEAGDGNDYIEGNDGNDAIRGDDGDDIILGGSGNDIISGGKGDDQIEGESGDDLISGDSGNDIILGGSGNDAIHGGAGNDVLSGDDGDDVIDGSIGDDEIHGDSGNDLLFGDSGNDTLRGGQGSDIVYGDDGVDILYGDLGDDILDGGVDADLLYGGLGKDILFGQDGNDHIYGELGDDYIVGGKSSDKLDGGEGSDVYAFGKGDGQDIVEDSEGSTDIIRLANYTIAEITFSHNGNDVIISAAPDGSDKITILNQLSSDAIEYLMFSDGTTIDMSSLAFDTNGVASYSLANIAASQMVIQTTFAGTWQEAEEDRSYMAYNPYSGWYANNYDISVISNEVDMELYNDVQVRATVVESRAWHGRTTHTWYYNDFIELNLIGTQGSDRIVGFNVAETINSLAGNDQVYGNSGSDTLTGGDDHDIIYGGSQDDTINAGTGNDKAYGGMGNDTINGDAGNDTLYGQWGVDTIHGNDGDDMISGGIDGDTLYGDAGNDLVYGDDGSDNLYGNDDNDFLIGGAGNDNIEGGAGDDYLEGGADNDTLRGGADNDILRGEDGTDNLAGDAGDDLLIGGKGADIIDGGTGIDTASYAESDAGVTINLAAGAASGGYASGDTVTNIENITGSDYDDTLTGNNAANILQGGYGNDTLQGGDENDELQGGAGADNLDGGTGWDKVSYADSVSGVEINFATGRGKYGHAEGDVFVNMEHIIGSKFNDKFIIGSSGATFEAGEGYDTIVLQGNAADYEIILDRNVLTARHIQSNQLLTFPDGERLQFNDKSFGLEDFPGNGDAVASIIQNNAINGVILQHAGTEIVALESNGSHGTATLKPDGTYSYTPASNYLGSDTFAIRITDPVTGLVRIQNVDVAVNANGATVEKQLGILNSSSQVIKLSDGSYMATWISGVTTSINYTTGEQSSHVEINAQRLDNNFNKIGSKIVLDSDNRHIASYGSVGTGGYFATPKVVELQNGNILYSWQHSSYNGVYNNRTESQVFDKSGNVITSIRKVDSVEQTAVGYDMDLTAIENGNVVASWTGTSPGGGLRVYQQLLDSSGNKIGTQKSVSSTFNANGPEIDSKVISLSDGGFITIWGQGWINKINAQRFDQFGNKVGSEFDISANDPVLHVVQNQYDITAINETTLVGVWFTRSIGGGNEVNMQIFDINGNLIGGLIQLDKGNHISQQAPSIHVMDDGNFIVTYSARSPDGDWLFDVAAQIYSPSGQLIKDTFFISDIHDDLAQTDPKIISQENNNFVFTWSGVGGVNVKIINLDYNLEGTSGNDSLIGDSKDEIFTGFGGADVIDGGAGIDTAVYSQSKSGISINLGANPVTDDNGKLYIKAIGGEAEGDRLRNIENIIGSNFNDTFQGDSKDNILDGGDGNDTVNFNDSLSGYTVTMRGDKVIVADKNLGNGNDGVDNFINIESFHFSDTTITLDDFPVGENAVVRVLQNGAAIGILGDATQFNYTIDSTIQATNGTVVLNSNGTYTYTPNAGYLGEDAFSYIVTNSSGIGQAVTINIEVANEIKIEANTLSSFMANEGMDGSSGAPAVITLSDGRILVTWGKSGSGSANGVLGRVFDQNGNALTHDFLVNFLNPNGSHASDAVGLQDGSFIVFWEDSSTPYRDGHNLGIFGQKFSANGQPDGIFFKVNDNNWQDQRQVKAEVLSDGNILVTWLKQEANMYTGMYGKIIKTDGSTVQGDFSISSYGEMSELANIKTLSGGGFVATWDAKNDGSGYGAHARLFTNDGTAVTGEILVNTSKFGDQRAVSVEETDNGGFVVVWMDFKKLYENGNQGGDTTNVVVQKFDVNGNKVGGEIIINDNYIPSLDRTWSNTIFQNPEIINLHNGTYFISWSGFDDVYGRVVDSNFNPMTNVIKNFGGYGSVYIHDAKYMENGKLAITWQEYDSNNGDFNIRTEIIEVGYPVLKGTSGNDVLQSGSGDDVIDALSGDNIVTTGLGKDTVIIAIAPETQDIITDFNITNDKVNLSAFDFLFSGFADLQNHMSQSGSNTVIDFGNGQTLTLQNVTKANLASDNFIGKAAGNSAPVAALWKSDVDISDGTINIDVLASVSDLDGDILTLDAITTPANGSATIVNGKIVYTANTGFEGYDYLDYTVSDGNGGIVTKTLTLNVAQINHSPTASDIAVTVNEDNHYVISAASLLTQTGAADIDGDALTISGVQAASHGTVALNGQTGDITFIPDADYNGAAGFTFTINDGHGGIITKAVNLTINHENDAPTANNITAAFNEDNAYIISSANLLTSSGAADVDGDILSISSVQGASNGVVSLDANGYINFMPVANFNGPASFTYTVNDGHGGIVTKTANLTVNPVNDAPTASNITVAINEDNQYVTSISSLLSSARAKDTDRDALTITSVKAAKYGTVELVGSNVVFTPTANFSGSASFTYTINDSKGGMVTKLVTLAIAGVNDAPTIKTVLPDKSAKAGTSFTTTISSSAFKDIEGTALTYSARLADGSSLPSWLSFNSATRTFSGSVPYGAASVLDLAVVASDGQLSATQVFHLNIAGNLFSGDGTITGTSGNDLILGGSGADTLIGGSGADYIDGAAGLDTSSYATSTAGVTVNLETNANTGGMAAGDVLSHVENIIGSKYDDNITGDVGNNVITGGLGADRIDGGNGVDTVSYADSAVGVTVNLTTNINSGGTAEGDVLSHVENVIGSKYADNITGNAGDNIITGGLGADKIDGGDGVDTASYADSTSAVTVSLVAGAANKGGRAAGDVLTNIEALEGSAFKDNLTGNEGDNVITGGQGADLLKGGLGHDVFHYDNLSDSNHLAYDTISDFTAWNASSGAGDKIDLVALHTFGIESFTDLTITQNTATKETIITANDNAINSHFAADGTNHTDFEIHLKGIINLHQTDFIWS